MLNWDYRIPLLFTKDFVSWIKLWLHKTDKMSSQRTIEFLAEL